MVCFTLFMRQVLIRSIRRGTPYFESSPGVGGFSQNEIRYAKLRIFRTYKNRARNSFAFRTSTSLSKRATYNPFRIRTYNRQIP